MTKFSDADVIVRLKLKFRCRLICSFNMTGSSNTEESSDIMAASIECTGGTLNFTGGPGLEPYAEKFSGGSQCLLISELQA